jgi:hypothetical protein
MSGAWYVEYIEGTKILSEIELMANVDNCLQVKRPDNLRNAVRYCNHPSLATDLEKTRAPMARTPVYAGFCSLIGA